MKARNMIPCGSFVKPPHLYRGGQREFFPHGPVNEGRCIVTHLLETANGFPCAVAGLLGARGFGLQ